jgi:hypothetical protein
MAKRNIKHNKPKEKLVIEKHKGFSLQQELFCKLYSGADDRELFGNGTKCYMKAYGCSYLVAQGSASRLLRQTKIIARINELLEKEGFNDMNVDKQHLFLINQHKDFSVKMDAIREYNKVKGRGSNRVEIVLPKPIIDVERPDTTTPQDPIIKDADFSEVIPEALDTSK